MLPLMSGNDPQARVEVISEARIEGRCDSKPPEVEPIGLSHAASELLLEHIEVGEDPVLGLNSSRNERCSGLDAESYRRLCDPVYEPADEVSPERPRPLLMASLMRGRKAREVRFR